MKDKEQEDYAQAQGLATADSTSPENASGTGLGLGLDNSNNNSLATLDALAGGSLCVWVKRDLPWIYTMYSDPYPLPDALTHTLLHY